MIGLCLKWRLPYSGRYTDARFDLLYKVPMTISYLSHGDRLRQRVLALVLVGIWAGKYESAYRYASQLSRKNFELLTTSLSIHDLYLWDMDRDLPLNAEH
jgi:hypothetical protein